MPSASTAEWLVEDGIGEQRAILFDQDQVLAARLHWPGALTAGQIEDALLVSRVTGSARGTLRFASGEEALVDRLPKNAEQGALIRAEVTRSALSEKNRIKLAQARPSDRAIRPAPSLVETLKADGCAVRIVPRFPRNQWEEIWSEAWSGSSDFSGGSLQFFATPAMVLIDVDGTLSPRELALAAVPALAKAIHSFDLAGSIGIDFPTLEAKADRRAVDEALAGALADWPHERTAINGFGFVQLVARLQRPSILHLLTQSRVGAAARLLLRRAEEAAAPGAMMLTCHPAIKAQLKSEWLDQLARRTGRQIRIEIDPGLALDGSFSQAVPL